MEVKVVFQLLSLMFVTRLGPIANMMMAILPQYACSSVTLFQIHHRSDIEGRTTIGLKSFEKIPILRPVWLILP